MRSLRTIAASVALGVTLAAAPAAAGAPPRPPGTPGPLGDEQLSDELTVTRWAYPLRRAAVRPRPSRSARRSARLHFFTEDGLDEPYLVLESKVVRKAVWLHVRLPMRPNGRTGWVPRSALGRLRVVTTHLRVNRTTLRATLLDKGKKVWSSRIGIGAASTPTPSGRYWIRERLRNLKGNPVYGPWAFGTSAYSRLSEWPGGGVIGLHGTNQPGLIPGRPSHGCIRVPNAKIVRLARIMPVGTPVHII